MNEVEILLGFTNEQLKELKNMLIYLLPNVEYIGLEREAWHIEETIKAIQKLREVIKLQD